MIRFPDVPAIPAGDYSQIEPSSIADKIFLFDDDTLGLGVSRLGVFIPVGGTPIVPEAKSNADLVSDGFQWYLELAVNAVLNCEVNGKSYNGQLDKTYPTTRFYCSGFLDDVTPQTIIIYKI